VLAKASVIPGTITLSVFRSLVQEGALLVVAFTSMEKEMTLLHLGHIILVKVVAPVCLLTQPAEPVLTNDRSLGPRVPELTAIALHARAPQVILANLHSDLEKPIAALTHLIIHKLLKLETESF